MSFNRGQTTISAPDDRGQTTISAEKRGLSPITVVERSPALVAVHDRVGWCGLFAADAEINDPVGSRPHHGRAAIERFYDTFIAPNHIRFEVDHDVVDGLTVMRDLTLHTTMSTGVALRVPMHLRYDLVEDAGALKIHRLYAHWELPTMVGQLLRAGWKGAWTSISLGPRLLRHQGVGGMVGFLRGFSGRGRRAKPAAERYLTEQGLRWRKVIAAGACVTATIEAAGRRGVALLTFDGGPDAPTSVRLFTS